MASKGKSKLAFSDTAKLKKSTTIHENALDNAYYINAQMKEGTWHMARILECRLLKNYDIKQKKSDASYEYYIHYEDYNRRMDEWLPRSRIQLTEKIIDEEHPIKKKRKNEEHRMEFLENGEHEGMDPLTLRNHEEATKIKTITSIVIGAFKCETWYYSPYPSGYQNIDTLYLCEFCLSFYVSNNELERHKKKCFLTHPPGDEIYRCDSVSVFEVDGRRNATYCENLGYLAKLFLDHKNLSYDLDPFLFYVLTENDNKGNHIVGYFSKEKESTNNYNLSCILTLPFYQRKGYGKFLITLSYEISIKEGKLGTPERPLSDLGRISYYRWWTQKIIEFFRNHENDNFSLADMIRETGIIEKDILAVLEDKGLIKYHQGQIMICTDPILLTEIYNSAGKPGLPVDPDKIHLVSYKTKMDAQKPIQSL